MPKSVSARSTCSGVAPSSTRNWHSYMYGNIMRLPTNPSQLPTTTPTLPSRFASAIAVASVSGDVFLPRTISTRRITFAGLKKCRPTTWSGRDASPASRVTERLEVFVAMMQPGFATRSSVATMSFLSARFSKTASMIRSTSPKPSYPNCGRIDDIRCSTCSVVKRPRFTETS